MSGFHGGRRKDQSDNVGLIVNNVPYKVAWGHPSIRSEERITIPIDDSSIGLEGSENTSITVIVFPYEEAFPRPPEGKNYPIKGPAHFRDIEIWDMGLVLHIDN